MLSNSIGSIYQYIDFYGTFLCTNFSMLTLIYNLGFLEIKIWPPHLSLDIAILFIEYCLILVKWIDSTYYVIIVIKSIYNIGILMGVLIFLVLFQYVVRVDLLEFCSLFELQLQFKNC